MVDRVLGLLVGEVVIAVDGSGHGDVPVVEKVLGNISDLIFLFLWERIGAVGMRGELRDVESGTRSSGVGNTGRNRTDTACAETVEKRGAMIILSA